MSTVSILLEIPEDLHEVLSSLIEEFGRNQDEVLIGAIALFILQNSEDEPPVAARYYLESIFSRGAV